MGLFKAGLRKCTSYTRSTLLNYEVARLVGDCSEDMIVGHNFYFLPFVVNLSHLAGGSQENRICCVVFTVASCIWPNTSDFGRRAMLYKLFFWHDQCVADCFNLATLQTQPRIILECRLQMAAAIHLAADAFQAQFSRLCFLEEGCGHSLPLANVKRMLKFFSLFKAFPVKFLPMLLL